MSRLSISFCASAVRSCSLESCASSSFERSRAAVRSSCDFFWAPARSVTWASRSLRTFFSASMSRRRLSSSASWTWTFSLSADTDCTASARSREARSARAVSSCALAASSATRVVSVSLAALALCNSAESCATLRRRSLFELFSRLSRSVNSLTCCVRRCNAWSRPDSASVVRNCATVKISSRKMMAMTSWPSASTKAGQILSSVRRERRARAMTRR